MYSDTIAAIATASGEGSIAIIRVSGEQAITYVDQLFRGKQQLVHAVSHTIHYGFIVDPQSNHKIEEVLVSIMHNPRSFTMEDVVEIHCHGGTVAVQKVLQLLLRLGARLAEPGEFTKRAFLNGRIDLSQAEAIMDLIRAKSDRAFQLAMKQSAGQLSNDIRNVRQRLLQLLAHLEVNIDYPEHDTPELTNQQIATECGGVLEQIDRLIATAQRGKWLREGIVTAIIGRPNVGKSSLLNALLKENRAIVTDIPGTTRDVIEEYLHINGVPLKLLDTAGIRETDDLVEQIGVEKSRTALAEADLLLFVLNHNEPLHQEEVEIIQSARERSMIVIINKSDLANALEMDYLSSITSEQHKIVLLSVKENLGLTQLEQAITDLFFAGQLELDDLTYVSNVRHVHLLEQARQFLYDAIDSSLQQIPIDIIQIDIREAWELLGQIIGDAVAESLLDQIFSQFCLGK